MEKGYIGVATKSALSVAHCASFCKENREEKKKKEKKKAKYCHFVRHTYYCLLMMNYLFYI